MSAANFKHFLKQQQANDAVVLLDGATGTELTRHRMAIDERPLWSLHALEEPVGQRLLESIHAQYGKVGAQIVTANTFRINPVLLQRHGLLGKAARWTREAVSLVRQGAPHAYVAGSMSPLESCYTPSLVPDRSTLRTAHRQTAQWMYDAGVDLVCIETMTTLRETEAALEAVARLNLPCLVSFCCTADGRLLGGESLEDAIRNFDSVTEAIAVNCVAVDDLAPSLKILCDTNPGKVGFYANLGEVLPSGDWQPDERLTADFYADFVQQWVDRGIRWVGGCCGSTPAHICELHERFCVAGSPCR